MEEHDSGYAEALDELIEEGSLVEGSELYRVALQAFEEGLESLSDQDKLLHETVQRLLDKKTCEICGEYAPYFDGRRLCGYHRNEIEKAA